MPSRPVISYKTQPKPQPIMTPGEFSARLAVVESELDDEAARHAVKITDTISRAMHEGYLHGRESGSLITPERLVTGDSSGFGRMVKAHVIAVFFGVGWALTLTDGEVTYTWQLKRRQDEPGMALL